ncbi:MAG TPA: MFS transporter [Polyangiaceae bacterium LLY-WYZ-14_1]|nr:MFS transporter [Polyangiaceae bacterium LLY-WYZ-14_1]
MRPAPPSRSLVAAIIASQFAPPFMFSGVAVSLPDLAGDLDASARALGLVETLFLAGAASGLLPWGRLADASDKATIYKAGLLVFCLASFGIGASSSVPLLLGLRFIQGAASSAYAATGPALLTELVPPERRGRVFGASVGTIYAGLTLGPMAAGALTTALGWRAVFLFGGGVLFAALLVVHAALRARWRRPAPGAVHLPSAGLLVAAMLCLVFGSAGIRDGGTGGALVLAGIALGTVFLLAQLRLGQPLVDLRGIGRIPVLRDALIVQTLVYTNAFTSIFLLSLFLQVVLERPADLAGRVLASGTLVMAVLAPLTGRLADRFSARGLALLGVAFLVVSSGLGTTLGPGMTTGFVFLLLGIQGIGFALFSSPNMTVIMNAAPRAQVAVASSLAAVTRQLGMISGMLATSTLIALRLGDAPVDEHPGALLEVLTTAFGLLALATGGALLYGVQRAAKRRSRRPQEREGTVTHPSPSKTPSVGKSRAAGP